MNLPEYGVAKCSSSAVKPIFPDPPSNIMFPRNPAKACNHRVAIPFSRKISRPHSLFTSRIRAASVCVGLVVQLQEKSKVRDTHTCFLDLESDV